MFMTCQKQFNDNLMLNTFERNSVNQVMKNTSIFNSSKPSEHKFAETLKLNYAFCKQIILLIMYKLVQIRQTYYFNIEKVIPDLYFSDTSLIVLDSCLVCLEQKIFHI